MSCCHDIKYCADLARLEKAVQDHTKEVAAALLKQDAKFADFVCEFKGNLEKAITEYLLVMERTGRLKQLITDTLLNDVFILEKKTASIINAKEFGAANTAIYANVAMINTIKKNGSASGFVFFEKPIKEYSTKGEEQTALTGTVTVPANGTAVAEFTYTTPFSSIPGVMAVTMRGAAGAEKGLCWCVSERLATGGKISITNETSGARSVSFSVYAKIL